MFFKKNSRVTDSHKAIKESAQHKAEGSAKAEEVHEVAKFLREARRQNHFAEQISFIMGKRP